MNASINTRRRNSNVPIIAVRNLVKIYKTKKIRFKALQGIDMDIAEGEFVAIVGTSGSGKSTLLNLMAGLEKPTMGEICMLGQPIHKMSEDELVQFRLAHVGFVFQSFNLMDTLSTLENAAFPLMLQGVPEKQRNARARVLLSELGLPAHLEHDPDELSGGQQQRVAIARALIAQPKILFADEPTGNLDSATAEQMMELLIQMRMKSGTTLVMVTHDESKAQCADRVLRIEDGAIVSDWSQTV